MKHILLGTTALVAAGLLVGQATAADPIKLSLGGFYRGAAGAVFGEKDQADGAEGDHSYNPMGSSMTGNVYAGHHRNEVSFKQDVEVHFKGETTLDNGLTVGAKIELEGQTNDDQIDAVYAYLSGTFGEFRFGDTSESMAAMCYTAPSASGIFGADSPVFNFSNLGTNGTCYSLSDNSTKLVYYTPTFWGMKLSASYAPEGQEDKDIGGSGTSRSDDEGGLSNIISVAGGFEHDFNGVKWSIGTGYSAATAEEHGDDSPEAWHAYSQLGWGGWNFGVSFQKRWDVNGDSTDGKQSGDHSPNISRNDFDNADEWVYGLGVTYNWDAWTLGLGWTHGEYEKASNRDQDNRDIIALTGAYALGPGITVDGEVAYNHYSDDRDFGNGVNDPTKDESIEVGMGFTIGF